MNPLLSNEGQGGAAAEKKPLIKPSPIYYNDPHGRFDNCVDDAAVIRGPQRKSVLEDMYIQDAKPSRQKSVGEENTSKFIRVLQEEPVDIESDFKRNTSDFKPLSHRGSSISSADVATSIDNRPNVRERKPPQTQLEILGSSATWVLILSPWILLLLTLFMDYAFDSCTPHLTVVTSSACPPPLLCSQTEDAIIITLEQPLILTQYVELSIVQNFSLASSALVQQHEDLLLSSSGWNSSSPDNNDHPMYISVSISSTSGNYLNHTFMDVDIGPFYDTCHQSSSCDGNQVYSASFGLKQPGMYANNDVLRITLVSKGRRKKGLSSLQFNLSYDSATISVARASVVVILFFFTIYRFHRSYAQMGKYIKHMSSVKKIWLDYTTSLKLMLPEQICVMMLLFWLMLWLNILNPICIFLAVYGQQVPDELLCFAGLLQAIGEQGLFFCTLVLFDGLKYTLGGYEDDESDEDGEEKTEEYLPDLISSRGAEHGARWTHASADEEFKKSNRVINGVTRKRTMHKYSSIPDSIHEFAGHHPFSPFYTDFILPKIVFLLINIAIILVTWVFKFPLLFGISYQSVSDVIFDGNVLACTEIVFLLMQCLWILFILNAMFRSGNRLRKIPFMISRFFLNRFSILLASHVIKLFLFCLYYRFRQMAYRLLMSQLSSGLLLFFISIIFQLYYFVVLVNDNNCSIIDTLGTIFTQFSADWKIGIGSLVFDSDYQLGSGGTVFIACICYSVAFIFVAPLPEYLEAGLAGGITHIFAILERDIPEQDPLFVKDPLLLKPYFSPINKSIFCLETACRLLECTWQSYFPPNKDLHDLEDDDSFARMMGCDVSSPMNISGLKLTPRSFYFDRATSTFGYLATENHKRKAVVTFRGTARFQNVTTDLNLQQTTLPNLRLTKRYFVNLLIAANEHVHESSATQSFGLSFDKTEAEQEDSDDDDATNGAVGEAVFFGKGDTVLYNDSELCVILEKHDDVIPPFYTGSLTLKITSI